ncbi:hypothetical protein C8R45DRAFT_933331 [Mycena sanguinolenta]|nr:hypothetical protein C8R45DRAFT_933331 [Mycena sanguinolenta]
MGDGSTEFGSDEPADVPEPPVYAPDPVRVSALTGSPLPRSTAGSPELQLLGAQDYSAQGANVPSPGNELENDTPSMWKPKFKQDPSYVDAPYRIGSIFGVRPGWRWNIYFSNDGGRQILSDRRILSVLRHPGAMRDQRRFYSTGRLRENHAVLHCESKPVLIFHYIVYDEAHACDTGPSVEEDRIYSRPALEVETPAKDSETLFTPQTWSSQTMNTVREKSSVMFQNCDDIQALYQIETTLTTHPNSPRKCENVVKEGHFNIVWFDGEWGNHVGKIDPVGHEEDQIQMIMSSASDDAYDSDERGTII